MRGRDDRDEGLFSYLRIEERVPGDHPLRAIRALTDEALAALNGRFEALYSQMGRPSIPPEHLVARDAVAGVLLGSVGTDADGADRLQPVVPLVRGAADGRAGLASDGVHQEPRPTAGGRCGAGVPRGVDGPAAGEAAFVERALHGRRHADRRLGVHEELPAEGRLGRAAHAGAQRRTQLPPREALQRHPRLHDRPGRPALPQGRWPEQPSVLHGSCPDGEPQRAGGRCHAHPRHRHGGARGGPDDARPPHAANARSPWGPTRPTT